MKDDYINLMCSWMIIMGCSSFSTWKNEWADSDQSVDAGGISLLRLQKQSS